MRQSQHARSFTTCWPGLPCPIRGTFSLQGPVPKRRRHDTPTFQGRSIQVGQAEDAHTNRVRPCTRLSKPQLFTDTIFIPKRTHPPSRKQTGDSKEAHFESTLVIAVGQTTQKSQGRYAPIQKTQLPSRPTANTRKRKPAKTSVNGETTTSQAGDPKDKIFKLVAQVPGEVKKASKPRKRKAPPRRSNTEQRALPDLPTSGGESKA